MRTNPMCHVHWLWFSLVWIILTGSGCGGDKGDRMSAVQPAADGGSGGAGTVASPAGGGAAAGTVAAEPRRQQS